MMGNKGIPAFIGVDSPEQVEKCLNCPYPYCYGRSPYSTRECKPNKKRTYESTLYENGTLRRLYEGRKVNVRDKQTGNDT